MKRRRRVRPLGTRRCNCDDRVIIGVIVAAMVAIGYFSWKAAKTEGELIATRQMCVTAGR